MSTVVLTDHAWPDASLEQSILAAAGHRLVSPYATATAAAVEALVAAEQPSAIMTCWAPVSDAAIAAVDGLKIVARMGVGLDNIGVAEATRRGAWVTNVPDYCVEEVSDHAVALALGWLRGVVLLDRQVRSGTWNPGGARLARLRTKTAGIVGFGRIGHRTAHKLAGLGMRVLALPPRTSRPAEGVAELVSLDTLLAESDVIFLHIPLTPETHHLVDATFLARMRPGSLLVNSSRGGLVDSAALAEALTRGPLAGAALDVVESEPEPPADLLALDNVILTPHVGFSSDVSVVELRRRASEEVVRVLAGQAPQFPCNAPNGAAGG
jgi:D-3-phosphoglycerate dehydrogenase